MTDTRVNRVEVYKWYGEDDDAPSGSWRVGYVTYTETEPYMVDLVRGYFIQKLAPEFPSISDKFKGYPRFTVHNCWHGYSEYTVTSTWHEVEIEWKGFRFYFKSTPEFFKELSTAIPADEDGYW